MASLAFRRRLINTCSRRLGSAFIMGRFSSASHTTSIPFTFNCWLKISNAFPKTSLIRTFSKSRSDFRENCLMWLIMLVARSTLLSILLSILKRILSAMVSFLFIFFIKKVLTVFMTERGWFSSWATPVAISPIVAILPACINCCSASRRLVISLVVTRNTFCPGYSEGEILMLTKRILPCLFKCLTLSMTEEVFIWKAY